MYLFLCLKALIVTSLKRICTIQADERRSKENIYDPAGLRIIGPLASKLMFDMEVLKKLHYNFHLQVTAFSVASRRWANKYL